MKLFLLVLLAVGALGAQSGRSYGGRIVGGSTAPEGAYPFIVKLVDYFTVSQFCAGAIIDEYTIITAAHCVEGEFPSNIGIVAGTNQVDSGGDLYRVTDIRVHANFVSVIYGDDIAILKINGPIRYSDRIQPIELETVHLGVGETCIGIGWGALGLGESGPIDLQDILLKTVSTETCKQAFDSIFSFQITDSNLCTFTQAGEGTCHGDSGGPLSCSGKLAGVVSGGEPCAAGYPDVFTRISSFSDWIEANRH